MDASSDEILLGRFQHGDGRAFTELYNRYRGRLFGYCTRLLNSTPDAEDAVHETFAKLHIGVDSLNNRGALRTWLYRVARNESYMILRRRRGRTAIEADDLWEESTPLQELVKSDSAQLVKRCLGMLKTEYRDALILREYDDLSYEEIAVVMETTVDSVKARLFKARKALAEKLKGFLREGDMR